MKASNHKSTRVVGLALLAGLWTAACMPKSDNAGSGGAVATGGSTKTGGTTATTSSAQTGGVPSAGTTAAGGAGVGGSSAGGAGVGGSSSGGAGVGGSSAGGAGVGGSSAGGAGAGGSSAVDAGVGVGGAGVGGSSSGGAGVGGSSSGGAAVGGSDSGGAGVGGTTSQTGGNTSAGGTSSAGGSIAGSTAASYAACTTDAGVVTGNACAPSPPIIAFDANCTLGLWSGDGISSGYFYQPWCNSTTTPCTLTMTCATNSMHIAGSYLGNSVATPVNGNAGLGANLQVNSSDAGPGCQMINASGLTGLTLDVNVTAIPAGNHLYVGMSLANGNSADGTAVLTTGAQTVKIPWGSFKNKLLCGSIPGPGITSFYIAFDWFNDGATHAVDVIISNFGFY